MALMTSAATDSCASEEMALCVSSKVFWSHIDDAPVVHIAIGDHAIPDQLFENMNRKRLDFVVIRRHQIIGPSSHFTLGRLT